MKARLYFNTMKIFSSCEILRTSYSFTYLFGEFAVQGTVSDFFEICKLFESAADYYRTKGIKQWNQGYDLEKIYYNIIQKETFIIKSGNGVLLCTFAISEKLPDYYPEYLKTETNIWIVKSLCTKLQELTCPGKKVIKKIIQAAIDNHISKIYLDCVIDNPSLEKYYERFGFERIVIVKHPKYCQDMVVMVLGV
ncbi:GNAT family N-acetyltransferase [Nostoc muscorum FACHB-395]|nr:GNAT family N-acetyltransferase [Desmonostoc muscorum FACHB-395]